MRYLKKLTSNVLKRLNIRLSPIEKITYSFLGVLFLVALILYFFENHFYPTLTIALLVVGAYIYFLFRKQKVRKHKPNQEIKSQEDNNTFRKHINIGAGNYNESIGGHYIQGDYINIQGNRIDLSKDINQIHSALQGILNNLENQGCSAEEAQAQIINELVEEVQRKPEIKSKLFFDKDADESDQAEELVNLLISNSYSAKYTPSRISTYSEDDDYEDSVSYKGHTIYLEADKDGWWYYKIYGLISSDDSGDNFSKESAIDEAKGKIDEERFSNW